MFYFYWSEFAGNYSVVQTDAVK